MPVDFKTRQLSVCPPHRYMMLPKKVTTEQISPNTGVNKTIVVAHFHGQ
jgi:hypothetical protein